jgi:hypothetical protein
VVKSSAVEPSPVEVAVMSPDAPAKPTTLSRAVAGGAISAVKLSAVPTIVVDVDDAARNI